MIEHAFEALAECENFHAIRVEIDKADMQLEHGEYTEYADDRIGDLAERIKARGKANLVEERKSPGR